MSRLRNQAVLEPKGPIVGRDKKKQDASAGRQVNFRASDELYDQLERLARGFGLDISSFVRLVLHENLAVYETRFEQMRRPRRDSSD